MDSSKVGRHHPRMNCQASDSCPTLQVERTKRMPMPHGSAHPEHTRMCKRSLKDSNSAKIQKTQNTTDFVLFFHIWHLGGFRWVRNTSTSGASLFHYIRNNVRQINCVVTFQCGLIHKKPQQESSTRNPINPGYPCPTQAVSWYQLRLHMHQGLLLASALKRLSVLRDHIFWGGHTSGELLCFGKCGTSWEHLDTF